MDKAKFKVGDRVRLGGSSGRMPGVYEWARKGRVVTISEIRKAPWLGSRHLGYVIRSRNGHEDMVLASYELREVTRPFLSRGRPFQKKVSN